MYIFKNLNNTAPEIIFEAFIQSFSHYYIPITKDFNLHYNRWINSGVNFNLSFGAFKNDKLVAFILHAPREDYVFNLATGVIPSEQGKHLIDQIYEFALPILKELNFKQLGLEVITQNTKAIRVYERLGFIKKRELLCFKGKVSLQEFKSDNNYQIGPVQINEHIHSLFNQTCTFEQDENVLLQNQNVLELHQIKRNEEVLAYAVYNPKAISLIQFGFRDTQKQGEELLSLMKLNNELITINNIDRNNLRLIHFFSYLGLENYISQYEMKMDFTPLPCS
ncbi:MAG: GNAT family N-acetyltransferase [Bacteriovoracaceae bacterium]